MPVDKTAELTSRFNLIDTNSNGKLELSELRAVFGAHAEEFLKFCDAGDKDGELTLEEFCQGIIKDTEGMSDEDFQADWLDRMSKCIEEAKPAEAAVEAAACTLDDGVCTLAPYFKLKDAAKFKEIWKADYENFAHKEDCVHYAFTFTDDDTRAHCREAYPNAEKLMQHVADVQATVFHDKEGGCLQPDVAALDYIEIHGPADQVEIMKEKLAWMGATFYTCEWGFRPAKDAMDEDTVIHLYPYFALKDAAKFKKIWSDAYAATKDAAGDEHSHQYAFSFAGDEKASCRESYADAEGLLLHLDHVWDTFGTSIDGVAADLDHMEVHGPAAEIEKVKERLAGANPQYFATGWGFRNASA